ncbi:MAG: glycosyltransferase, partial [Nitrospirota bacterium]
TGSTDRTKDIAKAFGAKVYDFAWTDSFSDARNFSLSKASGKWILVLDADEVISAFDHEKLRELIKGSRGQGVKDSSEKGLLDSPVKPGNDDDICQRYIETVNKAYSFVTRNYQDSIRLGWIANDGKYPKEEAGTGWIPSEKVRLFPNNPAVHFENPVHEFVESSLSALGIEVVPCDIPIHHYGKLNETRTASNAEYYYSLGKRKLAAKGEQDLQALYEIAVQATELEKHEEALRYWEEVCELKPDFADAFLMLADTYSSLGKYEEAASTAKKALSLDPDSREIRTSYAKYEIFRGNPETAIEELKSLIETDRSYPKALAFLAAAYLCIKKKREGLSYLELLNKTTFHASDFLTDFAKKLIAAHKPDLAIALLQAALEQQYTTDETHRLLDKCRPPSLKVSQSVSISLCMIVKNEEQNIARALSSVKPVVDEMVVVDTGSTDRTKDIAKAFGAKVYDFAWTDSFSDARNFSLSKASGKWVLVLDADEVISPLDHERIRKLLIPSKPPVSQSQISQSQVSRPVAYSFTTRNYVDQINTIEWTANDGSYMKEEAGTGWFPGDKVRLFPNNAGIRFAYPVHERIEPSLARAGVDIRRCDIPVHHYGKLNAKRSTERAELYFELGKKRLAEQGEQDVMALYDLAVQASEINKYEEALEYLQKVIPAKPDFARAYLSMGNAYFNLRKYEDAINAYRKALEIDARLPNAMSQYAVCEIHLGKAEDAIPLLEELLRNEPSYPAGMLPLAAAYICTGRRYQGLELLHTLRRANLDVAQYITNFAKSLMLSKRVSYAALLLEAVRECNMATQETALLLNECNKITNQTRP